MAATPPATAIRAAALSLAWLAALACEVGVARAADFSAPLPGAVAGDPARGRAIVANRQVGLCLLCHTGPIPEARFQGNLAPPLDGAGDRSTATQLRQRMVDAGSINPATIMPSYYKTEGLTRVSPAHQGKTILTAQQIEDVIAYLQTLRAEPAR
ncbi:sulfur oxidation c-type cytochrome SoxX [Pseudoduganella sp. UC29_71]|jgi:sulfur-oxidizing protein SoxX|uniref:sulfur oxidation c-type cytochrome SoxX n=1 Tax=Pseudoduganella sp. UC29_71 TaxID=3350174 RepID=UPI00366EE4D9